MNREPTEMEMRVAAALVRTNISAQSPELMEEMIARELHPYSQYLVQARAAIKAMRIDPVSFLNTQDENIMNGFRNASVNEWNIAIEIASPGPIRPSPRP